MQTLTLVSNSETLVSNSDRVLKPTSWTFSNDDKNHFNHNIAEETGVYALKVKGLHASNNNFTHSRRVKNSYTVLALVLGIHIVAIVALINEKATPPQIKDMQVPMMVSLVASPAPEPEVVPLIPTPPQPVIKKQKPIIKKVQPKPTPVAVAPEIARPEITEAPPAPPAPISVVKEPEVIAAAMPKVVAEPVIEPPRFGAAYLHNPAPDYPNMARRLGQQGRVLLKVLVAENGSAETVALATSSGFEKLDEAAIEAVKKWSFIPAKRNNQPMTAFVLVPVKFSLNN